MVRHGLGQSLEGMGQGMALPRRWCSGSDHCQSSKVGAQERRVAIVPLASAHEDQSE